MIKKLLLLLLFFNFYTLKVALAKIDSREFNGNIYVNEASVKETEDLFTKHHYRRFRGLKDNAYPAIFFKKFPSDYTSIQSQKYRNELFIRILAPLALKINEEILNERNLLLRLSRNFKNNKMLTPDETEKLENLALKYDYFTRLKGTSRIETQLNNLQLRIDIIPPSIFITYAAIESNWGFSRVTSKANSLYKEKLWYTDEGLEPEIDKNDGYRFKVFTNLIDSMRSFALTFNSDIKYSTVWVARAENYAHNKIILGESIAYALSQASNLPNFAGILNYTTTFYDLLDIDQGKLKRIENDN